MSSYQYSISIIFIFTIWGCVSSAYPILLWWSRECVLYLIIIIKPEVWIINHCLGLGHETMVCAVCLTMFLCSLKITRSRHRLIFNMGIPIPGKDGLYIEAGLDAYICHWSLTLLFHVILKYAEQRTETCQAVPSYIDMHCSYKAVNKCRYINLKHKTMEISSQRVSQLDDEISVSLHGELRAYHSPST